MKLRLTHTLIVEDDVVSRQLMRALLELKDYSVVEAACVSVARAELAAAHFDIVLLDIDLPEGYDLLREIRAAQALARLSVIAITPFALQSDSERLLAAGFDGHFSRPIDTRSFVHELEAIMRRARSQRRGPGAD
jgi:two-component system cell cycle response regulator DivK